VLFFSKMYRVLERSMMGTTLDTYSGPLPLWGTMQNGDVFEHRMLEHPMSESDGALWPTPVASDVRNRQPGTPHVTKNGTIRHINQHGQQSNMRLSQVVKFWATPTVNGNYNRKGASKNSGDGLVTQVRKWATQKARDWRSGGTDSEKIKARLEKRARTNQPLDLTDQVALYSNAETGLLNPQWVEMLMGYKPDSTLIDGPQDKARINMTMNHRDRLPKRRTERNGSRHLEMPLFRKRSSRWQSRYMNGLNIRILLRNDNHD
jgi:hypothetical protein